MASTKVLYSASIPTQGAAAAKAAVIYNGYVPYFVSGPLHRDLGIIGFMGATLHIAAWVAALVMDILLLQKLKPSEDTDKAVYDIWMGAFIPFIIGFGVLCISTVLHALKIAQVPEGAFPPFLMTLITAGAIVCIIFQFMLVEVVPTTLNKYTTETDAGKQSDYITNWRRLAMWGLIAKAFLWQFVSNNAQWAGPAAEYRDDGSK
jgi:hypothetical protein